MPNPRKSATKPAAPDTTTNEIRLTRATPARQRKSTAPASKRTATKAAAGAAKAPSHRAKGELLALAVGHLKKHPGVALTPGEIGRAVGGSSGAILNGLTRHGAEHDITQTGERPVQFTHQRAKRAAAPRRGSRKTR